MKENKQNEDIQRIFGDLPDGHIIKIIRIEPKWCKGFCEEVTHDPEDPIDLSEIKKKWGGSTFQLKVLDDQNRYVTQKTIRIADIPRDNYQALDPSFAETGNLHKNDNQPAPYQLQPPQQSDSLAELQKVAQVAQMMGWTPPNQQQQQANQPSAIDMQQQQMLFDMMQTQQRNAADMRRQEQESQREMDRWRREQAESMKPQEPLGDVKQTITLLRELNGMKSEFGGDTNPITEIVGQTAPIIESAVAEMLSLQKLKLQAEIARISQQQNAAPPMQARESVRQPLAPRQVAPTPDPLQIAESTPGGNGKADPVQLAADMGRIYQSLPEDQQQAVIAAFTGAIEPQPEEYNQDDPPRYEENDENDTLKTKSFDDSTEKPHNIEINDKVEILDEEDRAVLNGESINVENQDVQNGEHAGSAKPND